MKKISELINEVDFIMRNANLDEEIENIAFNLEDIKPKTMFFDLKNDAEKVSKSIKKGVSVIVSDAFYENYPCIQTVDIRQAMSLISANFYNNAHKKMHIIGVIGTNGKTTTTHILSHILRSNDVATAIIGTLGADINGEQIESNLTTPDPVELHRILEYAYQKDIKYVVMEISAHAIFFQKTYGIKCDFLIFSNISQDHLDFFDNMTNYASVKLNYFNNQNASVAIVNADDPYGSLLIKNPQIATLSYGLKNPSDVFAVDIEYQNGKTKFVVNAYEEIFEMITPFLGEFNVYNTLSAIAATVAIGIDKETIINALKSMHEVAGRFNIIKSDITVIIDYAHTPVGLENILKAVKDFAQKDIITVFGCGGNRDKTKRPLMGEICALFSNLGVITSDNPRMENPYDIIIEIAAGYKRVSNNFIKIVDRTKAIEFAIRIASQGDVVLIAGKGAEDYIDEKGTKRPYSDKETAQNAIRRYRFDKVDN